MSGNLYYYLKEKGLLDPAKEPENQTGDLHTMDPSIQDAIINVESSGRPDVIGDVGHSEGSSYGLMQIQENTAKGLYKQGLLPQKWNGKKVKRRDLPELLKDPEFNKAAGAALFNDNRRRLQNYLKNKNIKYSPQQLDDWTIRSHNQGIGNTIRRDILEIEPRLPQVDEYLEKVKGSQMTPPVKDEELRMPAQEAKKLETVPNLAMKEQAPIPAFADGGTMPYQPIQLTPEQDALLQEYINGPGNQVIPEPMMAPEPPSLEAPPEPGLNLAPETEELLYNTIEARHPTPENMSLMYRRQSDELAKKASKISARQSAEIGQEHKATQKKAEDELGLPEGSMEAAQDPEKFGADPEEAIDIQQEYRNLLDEYKSAEKEKNKARKLQALLGLSKAVNQFGADFGAGMASRAGGFKVEAPKVNMEVPEVEQLMQGSTPEDLKGRLNVLKTLKSGQTPMTPYQMRSLELRKRDLDLKEIAEKRRKGVFEFKVGETDKDRATKVVDEFNKDKQVQAINAGLLAADKAEKIIKEGGKLTPAIMGRLLARMAGEVGVMTDKDVADFRGSPAWTDALERVFVKGLEGKLTDTDRKAMMNMVSRMRSVNTDHLQKRAYAIAGQFAVVNDMPIDNTIKYLQPGIDVYIKPKTKSAPIDSKGEKIIKKIKAKYHNKKTKQTKYVYEDGTEEIVEGIK